MAATFTNEVLDVSGCKITLKRGGQGPTLLYLHGAGGAGMVDPFLQELASNYTVLIPEHPGFGGSDEPAWLDNIHDMAYFYLDFIDKLDVRGAHVVGASLGGWLAMEIAIRDASRFCAMTWMGPSGIHVKGLKKGDLFMWSPEERIKNLFHDQTIADRLLAIKPSPDMQEVLLKNIFTTARLGWEPRLYDPNLHKWLHRIELPTQIIWGEHDKILPAGYAPALAEMIAGSKFHIVPQCGHLPQVERPQEFLRLFREFAATLPR